MTSIAETMKSSWYFLRGLNVRSDAFRLEFESNWRFLFVEDIAFDIYGTADSFLGDFYTLSGGIECYLEITRL
jgi:hypothetical protein